MSTPSSHRILVVEDQPNERDAIVRMLRIENYDVTSASNPRDAMTHLSEPIDLVLSDLRMGEMSGVDLLRHWKQRRCRTPFIIMTAHGDVETAVEALRFGAEDYLSKPVNPDELLLLISRCLDAVRKDDTLDHLRQRLDPQRGFEKLVCQSRAMLRVFEDARRAAGTDSTVLVTGESGTGKEMLAEAIHRNSPRARGPFVTVNMASVPEHLVESELFGHTKGSFTGATESRLGRFAIADGGTIFIDEVGDLNQASQAKLLRVLETHCITPVGSNDDCHVDLRVVAATNRNLERMVLNGDFREDLYYRLNVIQLHLPALRERREDIPLLLAHFLNELSAKLGRKPPTLTAPLKRKLEEHDWPGNVRQLRNCMESMLVLSVGDELTIDDVPVTLEEGPGASMHVSVPGSMKWEELERQAVEQTLCQCGGHRTRAARALGISVRTLQRKLKSWGINSHRDT